VWAHFDYVESKNSSRCIIEDAKGKECGTMMAGKNPSNLKKHVETFHADIFSKLETEEIVVPFTF